MPISNVTYLSLNSEWFSSLWVPEVISSIISGNIIIIIGLSSTIYGPSFRVRIIFFLLSLPISWLSVGNMVVMFVNLNSMCVINSFKAFSFSGSVNKLLMLLLFGPHHNLCYPFIDNCSGWGTRLTLFETEKLWQSLLQLSWCQLFSSFS